MPIELSKVSQADLTPPFVSRPGPDLTTEAGQTEYVWERVNLTRKQTGINLLRSYMQIRRMLYTPSLPDVGGDKKLGAEDWYAAVSVESRAQLGLEAIVTKALLNLSNPGTVEDDVPDISAGILALIADATKGG